MIHLISASKEWEKLHKSENITAHLIGKQLIILPISPQPKLIHVLPKHDRPEIGYDKYIWGGINGYWWRADHSPSRDMLSRCCYQPGDILCVQETVAYAPNCDVFYYCHDNDVAKHCDELITLTMGPGLKIDNIPDKVCRIRYRVENVECRQVA